MIRSSLILLLCFLATAKLTAQVKGHIPSLLSSYPLKKPSLLKDSITTYHPLSTAQILSVPASYYEQHTGYFCKLEWKTEKALKFPFKFRLGSVQYVDHLEGKDK